MFSFLSEQHLYNIFAVHNLYHVFCLVVCYSVLHTEILVVLLLDLLTLSYTVKDLLKDTEVLCW